MDTNDVHQRVAIVETKLETHEETLDIINKKLDAIHADLNRFKGFAGGVMFVATAIGAALGTLKGWLFGNH